MRYLAPLLLVALAACTKKPKPVITPDDAPQGALVVAAGKETPVDMNEKILDLEAPVFGPIYFGFDRYNLTEPWKLQALGDYLKTAGSKVFLSGHASEEGATEYNLALGAKRAVAVRRYLEALGIPDDHITWLSYGEERPATQDPEQAHLNRRVEIVIEKGTP
ncbi:MAG TPA: OmpA family protein [Fibrobacteria bacterium]|nr:OmpA family protein [Fibrobacteria bacterium]